MRLVFIAFFSVWALSGTAAPLKDENLQRYFQAQSEFLAKGCLEGIRSIEDWEEQKPRFRRELSEMLGLDPMPPRTDLHPVITGKLERDGVVVEKLHFQSMPQLYVTGNLYLPAKIEKPLPAILYVCGHGPVKTNGISYGNKVAYQHHGAWFAQNGYACLIIDTIELGEIEGIHHGTYNEGMWWWNSRGYTPAGVEAWNGIRALDYLESRPEIDKTKLGVTGRSGGGAYSWWISALDERVKASAPVAGITDLQNYVVDGVVEGHCDCMFFVNTYRWDYPLVAALAAPRPLMIANSDRDTIFPLNGVERLHKKVSAIYDLYRKPENLALVITPGPHKDTQELQVPVFRWFNHHLKGDDSPIDKLAKPLFTGQELKVFGSVPADERTSRIHDTFVRAAELKVPENTSDWELHRNKVLAELKGKVFGGWPMARCELKSDQREYPLPHGATGRMITFQSQENATLKMLIQKGRKEHRLQLQIAEEGDFHEAAEHFKETADETRAILFTRGNESSNSQDKTAIQIRRRYMLLGQTLDGMRVWDILRGIELVDSIPEYASKERTVRASGRDAINLLYASLFFTQPVNLELTDFPRSTENAPDYLNVLRVVNLKDAIALSLENHGLKLVGRTGDVAEFATRVGSKLNWDKQIEIE
jgi:dienelactone hydrolase